MSPEARDAEQTIPLYQCHHFRRERATYVVNSDARKYCMKVAPVTRWLSFPYTLPPLLRGQHYFTATQALEQRSPQLGQRGEGTEVVYRICFTRAVGIWLAFHAWNNPARRQAE